MGSFARTRDPGLTAGSVELLLELIDQPDPVLSGSVLSDFLSTDGSPLLAAGLLKPSGHNLAVTSPEAFPSLKPKLWEDFDDFDDAPVTSPQPHPGRSLS